MSVPSRSTPPVLVLGRGITALGVHRTLARAGIPYLTMAPSDPLLRRSRTFRPPPLAPPSDEGELADWLSRSGMDRAVLLPCSDRWVTAVSGLAPEFHERFPASVPPLETVNTLVDKGRFADALAAAGTPHPWTVRLTSVADLEGIPDSRLEHAFLKPRDSQRFMEVFQKKALRVQGRSDAAEKLARVAEEKLDLVMQEYVPGPASNHFFIDGFVDRNGVPRAVFARQRLRMWPPDFGNSSLMRTIARSDVGPAVTDLLNLLESVAHRGIFSAEFKRDARDGTFRILEVNTRAWWYVEFAAQCGVDVCRQSYQDALGLPVETIHDYRVGVRLVFPYHDFSAAMAQRRAGDLTLLSWARSWLGARQPVFQWADPWPGIHRTALMLGAWIRKGFTRP